MSSSPFKTEKGKDFWRFLTFLAHQHQLPTEVFDQYSKHDRLALKKFR